MGNRFPNRDVTTAELVGVIIALAIFLIPAILTLAFPNSSTLQELFGGGRIVVFWFAFLCLVWVFRKKISANQSNKHQDRQE